MYVQKRRIKMAKSKLVAANKKIEEVVVGGYKKIENGVVSGFNKMADGFIDQFLTREGESVEEAKIRLQKEQEEREKTEPEYMSETNISGYEIVGASLNNARKATEAASKKAGL